MREKINILLVEDNPGDVDLIRIYMRDAGFKDNYDLMVAETLFEGIDIIGKSEVDLVLLDRTLPDTSNNPRETLTRYMKAVEHIPVILMTGLNNEIVAEQAVNAGAQDFLVKGQFDGKLLGRTIRLSLKRYEKFQALKKTTYDLTQSKERFAKAQQLAGFGDWELDLISNKMVWHDEIYRIFGYEPNSISTGLSDYMSYVHFEDRESVDLFFENAVKDDKQHKIEHRIIVNGTTQKWLEVHAKLFFEEISGRTLLVGGLQDITQRKLSEQLAIEQNMTRQTSAIKDAALQDMSFHIRTPLSSIVNLLYLIENTTVSPQQRELVESLKTSVDDLSLMISNMLNFSMLVSQNLKSEDEEFPIKNFIQSVRKIIQIKADNAKVKLDFVMGEDLPEKIIGDSKKITQIIYNLADHVSRYTPTGNAIQVSMDVVTGEKQHATFQIKVSYTGKVLTMVQIKELMEENKILETIKNDATDSDKQQLALAIVGKLVKILKGEFNIANKSIESTIFSVELPVRAMRFMPIDATMPDNPMRILLVEDHHINQMVTKRLLTSWSPYVTVDIAENGMIAVEKFKAHGYDMILMDLQMPVMNGFDAAIKIREKSKYVPIIALTATANKQEADRCVEIGMNNYIPKPFKPQELYMKIMKCMSNALVAV